MYNYPQYKITYPQYFGENGPVPPVEPSGDPNDFLYIEKNGKYYISGLSEQGLSKTTLITSEYDTDGNSVYGIYDNTFKNNKTLLDITITKNIKEIGTLAFYGCTSLTNIKLHEGLEKIGSRAFDNCNLIKEIVIPSTVKTISSATSTTGTSTTLPTSVEKVTFSDGMTIIPEYACAKCKKLTTVDIPHSVIEIGIRAFAKCESLSDIYYNGDSRTWNAIKINSYNDPIQNATIHYYDFDDLGVVNE